MSSIDWNRVIHGLRRCLYGATAALAACLLAATGFAHEGHDHGAGESLAAGPIAPRVTARSDAYALVGILRGERLVIYLDRFATNEPVTNATIAVTIGDAADAIEAAPGADGTYSVSSPRFRDGGSIELVFAITADAGDDLLPGVLTVSRNGMEVTPDTSVLGTVRRWLATWIETIRGQDARRAEAKATVEIAVDAPRRRPDGHVFVPKPTQRLLEVRTTQLAPQSAQRAVNLIGRTVVDPSRASLVQSINGGRVMAPESGLPRIGQTVRKGDLLARIEPAVPQADRTTILERQGEVEQLIGVAESKLRRLRILVEKGATPQSQVIDAEIELDGLRRRQQVLRDIRVEPEVLRAQTTGVIASARVVAGQVVQAQDVLFQIVDPTGMWVEALVYGGLDPASLGTATASVPGRAPLTLRFLGFSQSLQQHAAVVQFAVENPPPNLGIGLPVTVIARAGDPVTALVVPKDAIVRSGNGETIVWRHEDNELFAPLPVLVAPFDATRVIVAAGAAKGDRIVVRAAELVNQVR